MVYPLQTSPGCAIPQSCDWLLCSTYMRICHRYVDVRTLSGFTPLHLAARAGALEAAAALVQAGATLTGRNLHNSEWLDCARGTTPLHLAARQGNRDMCLLLLAAWVSGSTQGTRAAAVIKAGRVMQQGGHRRASSPCFTLVYDDSSKYPAVCCLVFKMVGLCTGCCWLHVSAWPPSCLPCT